MKYADGGSVANQFLPLFVLTEIQGTHQVFKLLKQKYDLFSYYVSDEKVFVNHSDLVITLSDTLPQRFTDRRGLHLQADCGQVPLRVDRQAVC